MVGAAISTAAAYVVLFAGMTLYAQSVYRVAYQWRRVATAVGAAVALNVVARAAHLSFVPSLLLVVVYPLALAAARLLPARRAGAPTSARSGRLAALRELDARADRAGCGESDRETAEDENRQRRAARGVGDPAARLAVALRSTRRRGHACRVGPRSTRPSPPASSARNP